MSKIVAAFAAFALVLSMFFAYPAIADDVTPSEPCYEVTIVHHPAVPTVIETIPAVPGVWANWSPNDTKGPQDYTPIWPTDERGTWQVHGDIPPGHEGPDGVYQKGQGNSPWFYRHAGTPEKIVVIKDAVDAYDEEVKTEVPCDNPETEVVTPVWSVNQSCLTPLNTWITAESTEAYTANVHLSSGHLWEIEFVANEGYEFAESDKYVLSDDKGRAVVTGRFLVVRCVVPHEPPVDEPEIGTPQVKNRNPHKNVDSPSDALPDTGA